MLERRSQQLRHAVTLLDVALTIAAFGFSYVLRELVLALDPPAPPVAHAALLLVIVPLWVFLLKFFRAYRDPRTTPLVARTWAVAKAVVTGLVVVLALLFLLKVHSISRVVILTFAILDVAALASIRVGIVWFLRRSLRRGRNVANVLIVGSGSRALRLAKTLYEMPPFGVRVIGYLDPDPALVGETILGAKVLGTVAEITSILKSHVVDEVILAIPRAMISTVEEVVYAAEQEGVKVGLMADLFRAPIKRLTLEDLHGIPILTFESVTQDERKLLVKRVIDLVGAALSLVVLAPVMALIAVAIRLDSRGPILFVQRRVGLNKRTFQLIKFRTMHADAETRQPEVEHLNEADGPVFKISNDPRITRVGRLLRRTSLDELPQLWNVLLGDMSLVGPRPLPVRDVDRFDRGLQRKRFSVKPGLTCLWQISGRSSIPFSEWLRLDLWYIDNWSILLDLKLLLRTIPAVLRRTGAV